MDTILDEYSIEGRNVLDFDITEGKELGYQFIFNTKTDNGIYWYDHKKKDVLMYSGAPNSVSKAKGIQTFINAYGDQFNSRLSFT